MTNSTAPTVRLDSVTKTYGSLNAIKNIDLNIMPGEFVTILGPSGSGKTTILNIVAGMTGITNGTVWINGQDVSSTPSNKRGLGMVFQNYALMPHMTIFENVAFPLRVRKYKKSKINEMVATALDRVRLSQMADRKPKELSGGQQQRVSLARSLVYEPSIILMDEPLGALDRNLREEMQLEIRRLHNELGITLMFVTHDQEEALTMSDRIVLMRNGQIEQQGTPSDLYFRPKSLFAARFFGNSNILPAHIASLNGTVATLTLTNGATLLTDAPRNVSVGDDVRAFIRPEHIQVIDGADDASENVEAYVTGTALDSIFLAGIIKTFIRLETGETLVSQRLTHPHAKVPSIGATVKLAWYPRETLVLQPDPEFV